MARAGIALESKQALLMAAETICFSCLLNAWSLSEGEEEDTWNVRTFTSCCSPLMVMQWICMSRKVSDLEARQSGTSFFSSPRIRTCPNSGDGVSHILQHLVYSSLHFLPITCASTCFEIQLSTARHRGRGTSGRDNEFARLLNAGPSHYIERARRVV